MTALISVERLDVDLSSDQPPRVLDVRWSPTLPSAAERYAAGHVPGAVYVDLDDDLAAPPGAAGRHPLPEPARLQDALRRLGVRHSRDVAGDVVVYDDANGTVAARAWWLLRWAGHENVRLLDGGLASWTASGRPLSSEPVCPRPGDIVVDPGHLPVVLVDQIVAPSADVVVLDARAADRYRGEVEPIDPVAGHVPGAVSAPTSGNVGADGRFLPADQLRRRFADLGVGDDDKVVTYCGSGVTAAHQVLALELAGHSAALYPGSWSEWVSDKSRPVATGPRPR